MKKSIITTTAIVFLLLMLPFKSFSQCHRYFAVSVGSGITYGGIYGGMLSIKPNSSIAISGAIGNMRGIPLGWGSMDKDKNGKDTPLNKETLTGIGYSVGIKIFPSDWESYIGIQYICAGTLNYEEFRKELPGINLMIGGNHLFGYSHFFMDWSINLAFLFKNDVVGGMIGASIGLGYEIW